MWVGIIALAGLDAETGIVMLLYLDLAWKERAPTTRAEAREAIFHGAVKRIRPKMMTVTTILAGLLPVLMSRGTGADVMKRIAAPMVGGVVTSALLELLVYPAIYMIWKGRHLPEGLPAHRKAPKQQDFARLKCQSDHARRVSHAVRRWSNARRHLEPGVSGMERGLVGKRPGADGLGKRSTRWSGVRNARC